MKKDGLHLSKVIYSWNIEKIKSLLAFPNSISILEPYSKAFLFQPNAKNPLKILCKLNLCSKRNNQRYLLLRICIMNAIIQGARDKNFLNDFFNLDTKQISLYHLPVVFPCRLSISCCNFRCQDLPPQVYCLHLLSNQIM